MFDAKVSPSPLIFLGSCNRGLIKKAVDRGLEGNCCMTTCIRLDIHAPAWSPRTTVRARDSACLPRPQARDLQLPTALGASF